MNVTFYMHYFDAKKIYGKKIEEVEDFEEDLTKVIESLINTTKDFRTKDYRKDRIAMYLNSYLYDSDNRILIIEFKSARYAKVRKVVNTINWEEKKSKQKDIEDGDEESTSIGIKFYGKQEAYCMYENNGDGVGFTKIREYLNDYIKNYHKNIKRDNQIYRIETNNMISQDFLYALSRARRIKAIRLIVNQKDLDISENKALADRADLNPDVEIYLKPAGRGMRIHHSTVKEFYKIYKDPKKKIKKIYVDADENDGNPLKFDTERMKDKHILDVLERYNGEVDTESLHTVMFQTLNKYN